MPEAEPRYPLLAVSDDGMSVWTEAVRVLSPHAERSGYLRGLLLLDGAGDAYRIRSYAVPRQWFWQRPNTPFGRGVAIDDLRYAPVVIDLSEAKQRVRRGAEAMPELLEEQRLSTTTLAHAIDQASSAAELASMVSRLLAPETHTGRTSLDTGVGS